MEKLTWLKLFGQIADVRRTLWADVGRQCRSLLEHAPLQSVEACVVEVSVKWSARMRGWPTIYVAYDMAPDANKKFIRHQLPAATRVNFSTVRRQLPVPRPIELTEQFERTPGVGERVVLVR
jgi:hypothetical protein